MALGTSRQLSSYLLASKDDPLVTEKSKAGFLVIDKTTGDICLDMYDLSSEVAEGEKFIQDRVALMDKPRPPDREFRDMPHQKSGNRKLGITCSYCEHKKNCWPNVRTFVDYTGRPTHLTVVKREPKMTEIKT